jgi:hypothetical protein
MVSIPRDQSARAIEVLETKHGSHDSFDRPMILLDAGCSNTWTGATRRGSTKGHTSTEPRRAGRSHSDTSPEGRFKQHPLIEAGVLEQANPSVHLQLKAS